jgi:REP element-mobilizing transposase RayT
MNRHWLLTWTTYGTWLPGDERGFVSPKFENEQTEKRNNRFGTQYDSHRPDLNQIARTKIIGQPVLLNKNQAEVLKRQFLETAVFRGWSIRSAAIMPNHIHLLTGVAGDPDPSNLLRDFKSYGSRELNKHFEHPESGTWWTEQGSKRKVTDDEHLQTVVNYIKHQPAALIIFGQWIETPGERGA